MRLQGEEIKEVEDFKYLDSTGKSNGENGKRGEEEDAEDRYTWSSSHSFFCDT